MDNYGDIVAMLILAGGAVALVHSKYSGLVKKSPLRVNNYSFTLLPFTHQLYIIPESARFYNKYWFTATSPMIRSVQMTSSDIL